MSEYSVIGKSVPRIDTKAKVTGRALYADDLRFPGMLYGKIVRCWEHAHAKVKELDVSEAAKLDGVVKILTPQDVTQNMYNTGVLDLMVPDEVGNLLGDIADQNLFTEHVRHQGDGICGVIAVSEEIAEKAASRIKVTYEPLSVYLTSDESKKDGAEQFTPQKPGNMAFELPEQMFPNNAYGWGDVDVGMNEADLIVEDTFYVCKQKQCQMEPHSYLALYDDEGRLHCWTSTQMPKCVHNKLARLFELPMSRVQVIQTTVGGGFGGRLGMVAEPEACAMAMAVPGRHVKISLLREEDWVGSESRHPGKYWMKIGFKKDGQPVAIDAYSEYWGGGYFTHASGVPFTTGAWLAGMYKASSLRYKTRCYYTHQAPSGAYRGYGNPQTNWVLEQLVDRGCAQLGIDPVEWRTKWHKDVGDDGWVLGVKYPSCELTECLKQGAKQFKWKEKKQKYANQTGRKRRGVGVAVMNHTSGAMPMLLEHTVCTVRMNEDASVEVMVACSDLGTGAHTGLAQVAAETLGIPMEKVHIKVGDSDCAGFDIGAHASRTLYVGGMSVKKACEDLLQQIKDRAASVLGIEAKNLVIDDQTVLPKSAVGIIGKRLPEKSITFQTLASAGVYNYLDPATGTRSLPPGQLQGYSSHFPDFNSPPFAAFFVEVEVDLDTGVVKPIEALTAYDIGRALHPKIVEGQIEGGVQQGLGMALTEEIYYNDKGMCLNSNFVDYKMLGPSDLPKHDIILVENPDPEGPYGAKSVGESGIVPPVGATGNAVFDALGVQMTDCPITAESVLKAIREHNIT